MGTGTKGKLHISAGTIIPYMGAIFVFVLFGILTGGKLLTVSSLLNLINNGFVMMICSTAAVPVFARGDLDFSIGSTEGVCLMVAGYIIMANVRFWPLALLTCVAIASFVGFLNGFIVNVLGIPSFVTTIAMNYIMRGLVYTLLDVQEVSYPVAYASFYNVVVCLIVVAAVAVLTWVLMENTKMGKVCKLDGENENAVAFSGLNNRMYGVLAFVYLGIMVGIASFLVSPRFTTILGAVGSTLAIDVLVACMIGGLSMSGGMGAKVSRPIIGSIIIACLNQSYALLNVPSSINQFTKGFLFVVVLVVTSPGMLRRFRKS